MIRLVGPAVRQVWRGPVGRSMTKYRVCEWDLRARVRALGVTLVVGDKD